MSTTLEPALRWLQELVRSPGPALALLLVGMVLASWFPFRFEPPRTLDNGLRVVAADEWSFDAPGIAVTPDPPEWLLPAVERGTLVLELDVRSADASQEGPARIVSLSEPADRGRDTSQQNLVVGQQGLDLVVRVRRPGSDALGEPALVVEQAFASGGWQRVVVRLDAEAVSVQLADRTPVVVPTDEPWWSTWDLAPVLTIGNTPSGMRPWIGGIRDGSVAAGATVWPLLAADAYERPDPFAAVPPRLRDDEPRQLWHRLVVGGLHLAAGCGLGVLLVLRRPATSPGLHLLVAAVVSIVLNAGKIIVATRHPSAATVVVQVAGAALGIVLTARVVGRSRTGTR